MTFTNKNYFVRSLQLDKQPSGYIGKYQSIDFDIITQMDLFSMIKSVLKKPEEQKVSEETKKTDLLPPQIQLSPIPSSGSRNPLQLLNIDLELLRLQFIKEEWNMHEFHNQNKLVQVVVVKEYICCDCELCLLHESDIKLVNTEESQLKEWFKVKDYQQFKLKLSRIEHQKNHISNCSTGVCQCLLFSCIYLESKQTQTNHLAMCVGYCLCLPWILMYNCCKWVNDSCSLKKSRLNRIYEVYKMHDDFILNNQKQ